MKKNLMIGFVIFLIALSLRVYRLESRYQFGLDEEYQATLAMTIVDDFHPIWIGVSASDTGFYLGPYWTYLTALLLKISNGDVLITAYFAALVGSITAVVIFLVVRKYSNFRAGVISGVLYSVLPMLVFFDQKYWNPSLIPLMTILFLYLAVDVKNEIKLYLLAILMAVIFHVHLSLLALFIPLGVVIIKNFNVIKKRVMINGGIIFLITNLPLIIFDYYKHGSNIKAIIGLSQYSGKMNFLGQLQNVLEAMSRLFYLKPGLEVSEEVLSNCATLLKSDSGVFLGAGVLGLVIYWMFRYYKESEFNKILGLSLISFLGLTLSFKGVFREYYLLGLFVVVIIALANIMARINKQLMIGGMIVIIFLSLQTVVLAKDSFGLKNKKELVKKVLLVTGGKSYRVEEDGSCHKYAGFRYLFKEYGSYPPISSSIDGNLGWLYPNEISGTTPDYLVTIAATKELSKIGENQGGVVFGGFTALVKPGW